jgi:hypothetical protein
MEENKETVDEMEELSEEQLQELMASYKKELAHIYRTSAAKRALLSRRKDPDTDRLLKQCDEDMREDINALKRKYGIHY